MNQKSLAKELTPQFALIALSVIGFGIRLWGIHNTSITSILGMPLTDDTYYYFSLARNLATGNGARVDAIHLTTGFQPLWGILVTVPFALFSQSSDLAISFVQGIGALSGIATGILLYYLVRKLSGSSIAAVLMAVLWLLSPQVVKHNLNGMETSIATLSVVAVFFSFANLYGHTLSRRNAAVIGIVCSIALLARVDAVILVIAISTGLFLGGREYGRPWLGHFRARTGSLVICWFFVLLIFLPWIAFTFVLGKTGLPESGDAVRVLSLIGQGLPIVSLPEAMLKYPSLFLPYFGSNLVQFTAAWVRQVPLLLPLTVPIYAMESTSIGPLVAAIVGWCIVILVVFFAWYTHEKLLWITIVVWAIFVIGMTFAYSTLVLGEWFYDRYGTSLATLFTALTLSVVWRVLAAERSVAWWGNLRRLLIPSYFALVVISFLVLLGGGGYRWLIFGSPGVPDDGFYATASWLNGNVDSASRVGVFQSGLIGYSSIPPVINLDGKVNRDAHDAILKKKMWAYVCGEQIKYVADWQSQINLFLVNRSSNWQNDNLILLQQIRSGTGSTLNIYAVNQANCSRN